MFSLPTLVRGLGDEDVVHAFSDRDGTGSANVHGHLDFLLHGEAWDLYSPLVLPSVLMTTALITAVTLVPTAGASTLAQPEADPSREEGKGSSTQEPVQDAAVDGESEEELSNTAPEAAEDVAPVEPVPPPEPLPSAEPLPPAEPLPSAESVPPADQVQPAEPVPAVATVAAVPKNVEDLVLPKRKGTLVMAAAGAVGVVGLGLMAWRIASVKIGCSAEPLNLMVESEDDAAAISKARSDCDDGHSDIVWAGHALANSTNFALAPVAGVIRAKYDAARSVKTGEVQRKPAVYIASGAALLSVGIVGRAAVIVSRAFEREQNCPGSEGGERIDEYYNCVGNRTALVFGMHHLSSSAIAGGAGLLAYGVVYKKERRRLEREYGVEKTAALEFTVQPTLSFDYTGVSANLRF